MGNLTEQYALWDRFLECWPPERLAHMTLDQYTQAGSKDTFTYWLEFQLQSMGSVRGGSAFKFGVFSRGDNVPKTTDSKLSFSETHGWYSALGDKAEKAFINVRESVCTVVELARCGDLAGLQALQSLGEAYKWKIAFHYQDRAKPHIVGIFKAAPLKDFAGVSDRSMADLQQAVLAKRPPEMNILEFGLSVWSSWTSHNLVIWKLSHGDNGFNDIDRQSLLDKHLAVMHQGTKKQQGQNFMKAQVGTLFYLCHGNSPQQIGQFMSPTEPSVKGEGWLQRKYKVLKDSVCQDPFTSHSKNWSPRGNSTFWQVPADDLPEFERELLMPYFALDLAELASLVEELDLEPTPKLSDLDLAKPAARESIAAEARNVIYYGPPGTGKTHRVQEELRTRYPDSADGKKRFTFVTFHQSYGYEEFIEGLRPVLGKAAVAGQVQYEIRPGAFKRLCERARHDPLGRYAMVIDEINRGNISKIFGELITLIEPNKRQSLASGSSAQIEIQLAYSRDSFSVPANVDILGTMNTADRSLALLDTALRRRFEFVAVMPDTRDTDGAPLHGLRITVGADAIDVPLLLATMNERIEILYDRDHTIGHAYFTGLTKIKDKTEQFIALQKVFEKQIIPLLEEYFFDDWQKIIWVLGDHLKPSDHRFIMASENRDADLTRLFGPNHSLNTYAVKPRYWVNPESFKNPDAYRGIYAAAKS